MEVKYIGVFNKQSEVLKKHDLHEPSAALKRLLAEPDSMKGVLLELRLADLQGVSAYSTQFMDVVNELQGNCSKELPYIITAMRIVCDSLENAIPDKTIRDKIRDLEILCKDNMHSVCVVTERPKDA